MKQVRVFFDVDTQNDFMNKTGALYVPDAELIKPNLNLLTDYAIKNKVLVLGSVDRHFGTEEYKEREGELNRYGGPFPDHCMNATLGEEKVKETYLSHYWAKKGWKGELTQFIPNYLNGEEKTEVHELALKNADIVTKRKRTTHLGGIYFEKQTYDVFTNPATEELLRRANVKEAIIYGVATDFCVKAAVLGLQKRKVQCYLVEDAIKGVFPDKTKEALEEMISAGVKLVKTKDFLEGRV